MELSVYIHFPWCLQKCPYCDFATSGIRREHVPHEAYADAVLRELQRRAPSEARLASVFFGGGTPSLWDSQSIGRVLCELKASFEPLDALEVSVECNPSSLDRDKAAQLVAAGVDRLSVGVQSLDDRRLRFLGRLHDSQRALQVLEEVRPEVPRLSADLMFGLPEQTPAQFVADVGRLVDLGVDHLSAYALTIEPATQFGALHRKGRLPVASDDSYAETFMATRDALARHGFAHYEVSNYARPGHEARHNQHYWRGGAYLGLGAAAVGCLPTQPHRARRYRNDPRPEHYMQASSSPGHEVFEEALDAQDLVREALLLGLRTSEGVHLPSLRARTGRDVRQGREAGLQRALTTGDCVLEDEHLRVPAERWLHLDGIVASIF